MIFLLHRPKSFYHLNHEFYNISISFDIYKISILLDILKPMGFFKILSGLEEWKFDENFLIGAGMGTLIIKQISNTTAVPLKRSKLIFI